MSVKTFAPFSADSFLAFDGLSLKEKIKERLSTTGLFTDQNYEGSNLAAFNDVMSLILSFLLFNLSKSGINSQFSLTQIYEAANGIVKELDYKPIGFQTANVPFRLTSTSHPNGLFIIPRFSFISHGGIKYSFNRDIPFSKTPSETILTQANEKAQLLYQGEFVEKVITNISGTPNEIIILPSDQKIDNFNIFIFVKTNDIWSEWKQVPSMYLSDSTDEVFEVRFNEKKKYEIKFGDNINGKQLISTDTVAIYYLKSDGTMGEIANRAMENKTPTIFSTSTFNDILSNLTSEIITPDPNSIFITNIASSSYYSEPESVADIKRNAPKNFRSQYSLTTNQSYETYLKTNFSNILHDVKVMNNDEYLDGYIKYFYELGLTKPHQEQRAFFNQINFADSCNFNNIYCIAVPKNVDKTITYMNPEQKRLIQTTIQEEKTLTSEIILTDPVYLALNIATTVAQKDKSFIIIKTRNNLQKSEISLKTEVVNTILTFFDRKKLKLGQVLNINQLTSTILAIDGVENVSTSDSVVTFDGLSFVLWNPLYENYNQMISGSYKLDNFQYPFLNETNLQQKIVLQR